MSHLLSGFAGRVSGLYIGDRGAHSESPHPGRLVWTLGRTRQVSEGARDATSLGATGGFDGFMTTPCSVTSTLAAG